jgi:hypothetical protein
MIGPIAFWRGRGCYLLNAPAQPKHDARPCPLGRRVLAEVILQALLEPLCIGPLVFGCGRVQEYGAKSPQFAVNSRSRPCILAYWPLHPTMEPAPLVHNLTPNCSCVVANRKRPRSLNHLTGSCNVSPGAGGSPNGGFLTGCGACFFRLVGAQPCYDVSSTARSRPSGRFGCNLNSFLLPSASF